MQQYSQIRDEIGGSGGHTLMVRDQHHGSSSRPPRGCAMPPMCISGSSEDDMPPRTPRLHRIHHPVDH